MSSYDYRCRTCDAAFEVRRPVNASRADVRCPSGHEDVARIWSAVSVVGLAGGAPSAGRAPAVASAGGCCGGGCCG